MARQSVPIRKLTKRGAERRYRQLTAELKALVKVFGHLRYGSAISPSMPDAADTPRVRRRRAHPVKRKAKKRESSR